MSIQSISLQTPVAQAAAAVQAADAPLPERGAPAEAVSSRPVPASTPAEQKQQLETAVRSVQQFVRPMSGSLEFSMDDSTGKTVIKVVDSSTNELIRQIPSEEMLEIARALDRLQGLLIRQKA
ncbi:flagellar protein FlaG [Propionivibrio sp.]|uniref:flagellar protein FlaG n=1 Tax=Propionivibrio sp. TaxID=2212460 RepID=UPI0025CDCADC|nr:flagellar protein FlaG [Propionivibrio sp.]MBK8744793.1 flagellar protein FlaG [Propionivibrio sp.]